MSRLTTILSCMQTLTSFNKHAHDFEFQNVDCTFRDSFFIKYYDRIWNNVRKFRWEHFIGHPQRYWNISFTLAMINVLRYFVFQFYGLKSFVYLQNTLNIISQKTGCSFFLAVIILYLCQADQWRYCLFCAFEEACAFVH